MTEDDIMDTLLAVKKTAYEYMDEDGRLDDLPADDYDAITEAYDRHSETRETLETALEDHDIDYDVSYVTELEDLDGYNTVISLGGDGTAITTAASIEDQQFAPIQSDPSSTAAICTYDHDEAASLATDLAEDNYHVEEWTRAAVERDGEFLGRVLNDLYVGKEQIYRPSEYVLEHANHTYEQLDNGVVVATGTGSTAWYTNTRDDGLATFDRSADELRYANMMPMQDTDLIQGRISDEESLQITSSMNVNGAIVLDGDDDAVYSFPRGSTVQISIADEPLTVIRSEEDNDGV